MNCSFEESTLSLLISLIDISLRLLLELAPCSAVARGGNRVGGIHPVYFGRCADVLFTRRKLVFDPT
ncbi:MAG: hypothetical protein U0289_10205 [Cyclobacteriaceae bacterium]